MNNCVIGGTVFPHKKKHGHNQMVETATKLTTLLSMKNEDTH